LLLTGVALAAGALGASGVRAAGAAAPSGGGVRAAGAAAPDAGGVGAVPRRSGPTVAANQRAARRDAHHLLSRLRLPPEATAVPEQPAGADGWLKPMAVLTGTSADGGDLDYDHLAATPGTLVISTSEHFLYLVLGDHRALRYGIGVGRQGFQWSGMVKITRKTAWPDWTPPPEMIARQPYLPRFMAGGPGNPMGARALYLGATVYRIHGTNQPETIGQSISSGCFRLANGDVVDLYERASVGTKVVVRQAPEL